MKAIVVLTVISAIAVIAWRSRRGSETPAARLERLRSAIDRSALPQSARHEVRMLLDEGRLRPSQYLAGRDARADALRVD